MPEEKKSRSLLDYYRSLSRIQLVEHHLEGGYSEDALSLLEAELIERGIDPGDIDDDYLDRLIVVSGRPEGSAILHHDNPVSQLWKYTLRFKIFATNRPLLFCITISVLFLSVPIVEVLADWEFENASSPDGSFSFQTIYLLFEYVVCLLIVIRFGWFRALGFLGWGRPRVWILMLFLLSVELCALPILCWGEMSPYLDQLTVVDTTLGFLCAFVDQLVTAGLIEEAVSRGLILYCFLRVWGDKRYGILKSALVSSILFGLCHIPISIETDMNCLEILLKVFSTFSFGIVCCAFLLVGGSIWIPVIYHSMSNTLVPFLFVP